MNRLRFENLDELIKLIKEQSYEGDEIMIQDNKIYVGSYNYSSDGDTFTWKEIIL